MRQFGVGILIARAAATAANPNPTPRKFGVLQNLTEEESFDDKPLYGGKGAPIAGGRGKLKVTLKAKFAEINGRQFSELFNRGSVTSGGEVLSIDEIGTVPSGTGNSITAANAATFVEDLGVTYLDGTPLKLVPSAPVQGQYAISDGVYSFSAADAGVQVLITYAYTVTTGYTVTKTNQYNGQPVYFEVRAFNPDGGGVGHRYPKCYSNKLSRDSKQDDWIIPEMDITVVDNGSGVYGVEFYGAE